MKKVYLFLANGFEEVEGLTVVDLLRRAGIECLTVSITGKIPVTSSHNIAIHADRLFEDGPLSDADMLVLPGGMPGTSSLLAHEGLRSLLLSYAADKKYIAAICAAPSVLGANGLLNGKRATCYPGFEQKLTGAAFSKDNVVIDGNIITSRGLGTAIEFALALITTLTDTHMATEVATSIQYYM